MSASSLRALALRRNESELLADTCTVIVPGSGQGPLDPDTGVETGDSDTVLWSGPCWLKVPPGSSQVTVGGDVVAVQRPSLAVPLSAPRFPVGAVATITASLVPLNVGRRCAIRSVQGGTYATLARYEVDLHD